MLQTDTVPLAGPPLVMIVEPDVEARTELQVGLAADGMAVAVFASHAEALAALETGLVPAVLVTATAPGAEGSTLITRCRVRWPRLEIVFTGPAQEKIGLRGVYHLATPCDAAKLSHFLRLVVARPALRSALQSRYRLARQSPALAIPRASALSETEARASIRSSRGSGAAVPTVERPRYSAASSRFATAARPARQTCPAPTPAMAL